MAADEITARDAWRYAREQAALLLDTDLTHEEVTEAGMNLASAFRDLDTGTVTGSPVGGQAKAELLKRAESYASDARKFTEMTTAWDVSSREQGKAKRFAIAYRLAADELRKVAASL